MTELTVVTILAGVLAVGIGLAALAFALLYRLEGHIDDRFGRIERGFEELAERVARLEVEGDGSEERPHRGRTSAFERSPTSFRG